MAATLRFRSHGQPHGRLIIWLGVYESATPGIALGDNPTVRFDLDNEPQPDAVLLIEELCGGQSRLSEDDYIEGAPELVAEIAASSAAIDAMALENTSSGKSLSKSLTGFICRKSNTAENDPP